MYGVTNPFEPMGLNPWNVARTAGGSGRAVPMDRHRVSHGSDFDLADLEDTVTFQLDRIERCQQEARRLVEEDEARLGRERPGDAEPALVAVRERPGGSVLGVRQAELSAAGIEVSDRAGQLRAAFHLYNTEADVDRLLEALGDS